MTVRIYFVRQRRIASATILNQGTSLNFPLLFFMLQVSHSPNFFLQGTKLEKIFDAAKFFSTPSPPLPSIGREQHLAFRLQSSLQLLNPSSDQFHVSIFQLFHQERVHDTRNELFFMRLVLCEEIRHYVIRQTESFGSLDKIIGLYL